MQQANFQILAVLPVGVQLASIRIMKLVVSVCHVLLSKAHISLKDQSLQLEVHIVGAQKAEGTKTESVYSVGNKENTRPGW